MLLKKIAISVWRNNKGYRCIIHALNGPGFLS